MNFLELAKIKAELLCYGVRLDECAKEKCVYQNSYLLDGGFVHAAHFLIGEIVVNTCITEAFCKSSPYVISCLNDRFILLKHETFVCDIEILPLPKWCTEVVDGFRIGDYFRPHSPDCISGCPQLECTYYKAGNQCKFCSLVSRVSINDLPSILSPHVVAKMIKIALDYNPKYEVALSGGTCSEEDRTAKYFAGICKELTKDGKGKIDISIELAPPDKDKYIEELFTSGATALIFNIEIADEELRRIICPGKSNIPLVRYFSAFKKAVSVFGRGNVSSVLIAGIQPAEDILSMCEKIIPMGVVPTIIPFKPLDNCLMSGEPIAKPEEVFEIAEKINKLLQKENLHAYKQGGCTKCGGCSLESVFQMAYQ